MLTDERLNEIKAIMYRLGSATLSDYNRRYVSGEAIESIPQLIKEIERLKAQNAALEAALASCQEAFEAIEQMTIAEERGE